MPITQQRVATLTQKPDTQDMQAQDERPTPVPLIDLTEILRRSREFYIKVHLDHGVTPRYVDRILVWCPNDLS